MELGDTVARLRAKHPGQHHDTAVLLGALALFAAVFGFHLLVANPADAPALLYALPIALVATQLGMRAGLMAAALAILLFGLYTEVENTDVGLLGHLSRSVVFLLLGGLLGRFSDHLRSAHRSVQENEGQLQAILNHTSAVISLKDLDGRYVLVNPQFERLFGVASDDVLGKTDYDLFPKYSADAFRATDRKALRARTAVEIEETVPQKDGQHTYISVRFPVLDSAGVPYAVCGISTDITQRTRATDDLLRSREQVRQVIDTTREAFISIDAEGLITGWNRQAEETFGWPFSRAIGQPLADLIIPERFRDSHVSGLERFRTDRKSRMLDRRMELTALHRDGHEFPIEITITATRIKGGYEFNAFLHDITERRSAEIALRASWDEISDLYNNAPCGYHSLDNDGTFVRINDTELEWLGYERDEIIGNKKFADLATPESLKVFEQNFPAFKETGQVQGLEFDLVRKDGTIMPVLLNATVVRDADGEYVMSRSTLFDITDRRRAEKLARVKAELELKAAELERSNAELAQFARAASHDLAEPIRTVSSYVQLIQDRYRGKLDEDADEFIGFVVDGAAQMQALIDGLRAYSTAGSADYVSQPIDCADLVPRVIRALQTSIDEAGATITLDAMPTVWGDSTQLAEVFQNLLSNAIKFVGDEPPSIHVSAEREPKAWCFLVTDNGIGVKPQYAHRIFDMFGRLHGRQAYPGTGIGLTICKKIVDRHGGGIWVEPAPEGGSSFRFTIPDTQVEQEVPPAEQTSLSRG